MTMHIEAIYENGVLKPIVPLALDEGARVEITLQQAEAPPKPTPYEIMSAIASLPLEVERVETAGLEHDKFLYVSAE